MRLAYVAILATLVAGCSSHSESGSSTPSEGIHMEILSVTPANPVEGDDLQVSIRLTNGSKDILVLGKGKSRYGGLSQIRETITHNMMSQQATPAVFYEPDQIVIPGEGRTLTLTMQALGREITARVAHARHDAAAFAVYVHRLVAGARGDEAGYERLTRERFASMREHEKEVIGGCIILDKGAPGESTATSTITLKPREFPLAEARKKFGETATELRWSKGLDGWVLATAKRAALVQPSRITELPPGSIDVAADLDAGREKIMFRLSKPKATALATSFKTHEGDGMYTRGTFIDVPKERVVEALETARKEGLSVRKVNNYLENYYFEF